MAWQRPLTLALVLAIAGTAAGQEKEKTRRLLVIGQAKGYQHETISTAMVTLYNLGRGQGSWETYFRTDCAAITKKPLKYGAKNLNDFDAVAFFTDGDLDMDASQKADLLSFVRDDGKGFLGVHSAAITFTSWREYGEMLGGYYDGHPWGVFDAPLIVEDPAFPGLGGLPRAFTLRDEIYQVKDFSRERVRVLLRLDAGKLDLTAQGGPPPGQRFRRCLGPRVWQGARHLQRPGSLGRRLGPAGDAGDVAGDGPLVHGTRPRRRGTAACASAGKVNTQFGR